MFVVDVSPSMGNVRDVRQRQQAIQASNLELKVSAICETEDSGDGKRRVCS